MKKNILLLAVIVSAFSSAKGQEVIAPAGHSYSGTTASIDFTLGETVIFSPHHESGLLTQGFHQGDVAVTEILTGLEQASDQLLISVFPNPTSKQLIVETGEKKGLTAQIINLEAKEVYKESINSSKQVIDVSGFKNGIYILHLSNEQNELLKSFKILKLN